MYKSWIEEIKSKIQSSQIKASVKDEKKGLIRVKRDDAGRRCYEESDVEWIRFLKQLKETGMLEKRREYVMEQQRKWAGYMENLDDKISFYKGKR